MSDLGHLHYDNIYTASFPGFHTDNQVHHFEYMKTHKEHRVAEEADNMNKADIIEAAGAAGAAGVDRTEVVDRAGAGKAAVADRAEAGKVAAAEAAADKVVAAEADRAGAGAGKQGIVSHSCHNNNLQGPEEAGILMQEGRSASVNPNQEKQTFSPCQNGLAAACSWNPASHRTQCLR